MKIGLLECDHVADRLRHIDGDYREMFTQLVARYAPEIELVSFDAQQNQLPDSIDACDGYMTTGSRFSAYDEEPWIDHLKGFVRRLAEADKPFVGICFGHQILAEALGGVVAKADAGWGIGAHAMRVAQREDWMHPDQNECTLAYSHRDQVQRLPGSGVVLASTDHCPVAMFTVGDRMLGIQGHPEFSIEYAEALASGRREIIDPEIFAKADFAASLDADLITRWIDNFLRS